MTGRQEEFDAIVAGLRDEINYHGLDLQQRMELASQDPLVGESVGQYLQQDGEAVDQVDIVRIGQEICDKYGLVTELFVEVWNMCSDRLEGSSETPSEDSGGNSRSDWS